MAVFSEHAATNEMPFCDPEKQRAYMKAWRAANEKKVVGYQRAAVLESALKNCRFPTPRSVGRHALTGEELERVLASVLRAHTESTSAASTTPSPRRSRAARGGT